MDKLDISVVVPLYNEAESLPELAAWIDRVARENGLSYELILVDDGSSDGSWEIVEGLKAQYPAIRGIGFARNYGKSAALYCGFAAAEGEVVITMDADLQDSPDEIPELRRMILEEGYDLVSGWKKRRHDPVGKRWPSKFFNWTARSVSGIRLHDFNCGLKAYRRKVVKAIEVYGEMHRFIPILAKQAGFRRIGEKVVDHHARKYGHSKFGMERMVKGYLDLISVLFMSHFGRSPMYFFGSLGTLMFLVGGGTTVWITMDADLQDSPDEIPELRRMILEEGYDLVSGWKKRRHDPVGKRWPSKFFNWTARSVSGIRLHDFNCGLKAYRRKVVKAIEVYGEMHRFIPILAKQAGFRRIGEKVVDHHARKYGHSKFGMERMVKGYLDLISVLFMSHFGRSPMYFFGSLGTLMFLVGGGTTVWIIAEKLWKQFHDLPLRAVTDQPLFYLAILAVILGVQLFLAGFLGELINRGSSERNKYLIDKTL